jgi:tetratricopeptide (TPR) repeat protein
MRELIIQLGLVGSLVAGKDRKGSEMKFRFERSSLLRFRLLRLRKRSFVLRIRLYPNDNLARLGSCMAVPLLFMVLVNPFNSQAQKISLDKRLERAAALISEKRISEAEQQLSHILKIRPNNALALNLLGTIRAQQRKLDEAQSLFARAISADGQLIGPRLNLAYLYSLKGDQEKSISELKGVLSLDPSQPEALEAVARSLLARGQIDETLRALERTTQPEALSAPLLVLLGDEYLKKGNLDKAQQSYQFAVSKQSEDADAILGLAQVYQFRGDAQNALVYLSRARKLVATSPETLYRFALVSARAGLYEEANVSLQAAIKLKPDEAAYFVALGNTWLKKPDVLAAEHAFRRAVELQPDGAQAQMYLGYALMEQKKYPEAREWLEKSLARDAGNPETFYYLGLIAQEQNEDDRAIDLLKKAIQLVPSFSFPHAALGSSYLKLKNYPLAKAELELSVKLNPDDAKAHYSLAVLYARLKEPERAQQEMQIVEKLKQAGKTHQKERNPGSPSASNPR